MPRRSKIKVSFFILFYLNTHAQNRPNANKARVWLEWIICKQCLRHSSRERSVVVERLLYCLWGSSSNDSDVKGVAWHGVGTPCLPVATPTGTPLSPVLSQQHIRCTFPATITVTHSPKDCAHTHTLPRVTHTRTHPHSHTRHTNSLTHSHRHKHSLHMHTDTEGQSAHTYSLQKHTQMHR